jgi:hypothetical protein
LAVLTVMNSYGMSASYTNPTQLVVVAPRPTILPAARAGTNLVVSATTLTGYNYVLEMATSLNAPITWTPVSTNAGTGGTLTNMVPISGSAKAFFRYQAQ